MQISRWRQRTGIIFCHHSIYSIEFQSRNFLYVQTPAIYSFYLQFLLLTMEFNVGKDEKFKFS